MDDENGPVGKWYAVIFIYKRSSLFLNMFPWTVLDFIFQKYRRPSLESQVIEADFISL